MTGRADDPIVALAREAALLAAESVAAVPHDRVARVEEGWPERAEAWRDLGSRMRRAIAETGAGEPTQPGAGLGGAERWLVAFATAAEIHPDAAAALSIVAEDERLHLPSALTVARVLAAAGLADFTATLGTLLHGGRAGSLGIVETVETSPGRPVSQRGLRLSAHELRRLLLDDAAEPAATLQIEREPRARQLAYPREIVSGAAELLARSGVLWLRAATARAGRQFALDVASVSGEEAAFLTGPADLPDPGEVVRGAAGLLAVDLFGLAEGARPPLAWLYRLAGVMPRFLVVAPPGGEAGRFAGIMVPPIGPAEARRVFAEAPLTEDERDAFAALFRLNLPELRAAIREAEAAQLLAGRGGGQVAAADLREAILNQGARRMGRQVTVMRPVVTLDRLVAPPVVKGQLRDAISARRVADRVYGEMGVGRDSHLGRGLVCLFSGPPGTGKTFAAQCFAAALGLNLLRVDLSQVVSKFIGETEKALAAVFDEAEAGHGVLLFDEADALFGRRSEVKDSHDRYANIEIGYLLQRMESFDGTLILATNLRNNLDPAFTRRIHFLLDFPMPDRDMRVQLWRQSLPAAEYWDERLDVDELADRFRLSGGSIRNIAAAAAHLAAATPRAAVTRGHVALAVYRELEKNGQSRTQAEFGPLAGLLPEGTWTGASP